MTGFYVKRNTGLKWVHLFQANGSFLYLLKVTEKPLYFWYFQGV